MKSEKLKCFRLGLKTYVLNEKVFRVSLKIIF